ncbi:MAG TPA: ABC transporter substrate-binding protein [Acidimicrobiales bacterium]|nr:ABC transporter substrate-binding protein [Acidimicrobiales bacterium]
MRRTRFKSWAGTLAALLVTATLALPAAASVKPHAPVLPGKNGGHLTVVSVQASGAWVGMDPFLPNIPPGTAAMFPVWDPLFNMNPATNSIELNSLATGYHVTGGGLAVTIELRKHVKFQDGTAFNAAAVVWNLERYASATVNSECTSYLAVVTSVVASGPYTVVIHLSARDAGLIPLLATQQCALMVSPTAYQAEGASFTNDPVGTGPYKFQSGTPGSVANFVRWTGYWGGKPHLDEVTVETVTSDANALTALQSGTAQAWLSFVDIGAVPQILQAKADPSLRVSHGVAASITYVTFSFTHSPFDNALLRQAVTYATNPKAIDAALYHNVFKPVEGVFPPASWAYSGNLRGYPSYNPAKAQAIVKQLGGSVTFNMLVSAVPTQVQLADALQAQWQAVGINAQIQPVTTATLITNLHALTYAALQINSPGLPDPDNIAYRWFYSGSALTQNGLKSAVADKLILAARSSYGRAARVADYHKLNNYLSSVTPWDDIAATNPYNIVAKNLHGLPATPYSLFPWESAYFS